MNSVVSGINAGIEPYRRGEHEKALRIFRRIAKHKNCGLEPRALVGIALHKLGRQFEALEACEEAQALADVAVRTHCAGMTQTARIRARQNVGGHSRWMPAERSRGRRHDPLVHEVQGVPQKEHA